MKPPPRPLILRRTISFSFYHTCINGSQFNDYELLCLPLFDFHTLSSNNCCVGLYILISPRFLWKYLISFFPLILSFRFCQRMPTCRNNSGRTFKGPDAANTSASAPNQNSFPLTISFCRDGREVQEAVWLACCEN